MLSNPKPLNHSCKIVDHIHSLHGGKLPFIGSHVD